MQNMNNAQCIVCSTSTRAVLCCAACCFRSFKVCSLFHVCCTDREQCAARAVRARQIRAQRVHGRRPPVGLQRVDQTRPAVQTQPQREQIRAALLRALAARPHHLLLPQGRRALRAMPLSLSLIHFPSSNTYTTVQYIAVHVHVCPAFSRVSV